MLISAAKKTQANENTDGVSSAGWKYFLRKSPLWTRVK